MGSSTDPSSVLDGIFEASPMPILVHDFDSLEVVRANHAAADLLDLPRAELQRRSIGELVPELPGEEVDRLRAIVERAKSEGSASAEWNPLDGDGQRRNVTLQLEVMEREGTRYLVSYVQEVTETRQQEAALREQELLRESVFNSPEMFVGLLDADGTLLEANRTALQFAGVAPEDVEGKPFYETVWWADERVDSHGRLESAISAANAGQTARFTTEHYSADGDRIVASVVVRPVFDDDEVRYIIVEGTDITVQQERERELREQSEELQALVNNLPVILFTTDGDGIFTRSVGKGLETLGLEPGEFVGASIYDVYGDSEDIVGAFEVALDGEEVRRTHSLDGLSFETWYRPVLNDAGQVTEVIGVARDVTEIKRREQRIQAIGEASRDLMFAESTEDVADIVLGIANEVIGEDLAAIRLYDEEDDVLRPISATEDASNFTADSSATDLPVVESHHDEMDVFRSGDSRLITDYQDIDDPAIPESWLDSLFLVPLGEYGLLSVGSSGEAKFDDVEQYLLEILARNATAALENAVREEELLRYREELERSNESLQQFAYVASHDLQEPLRMVSSYMDLLEAEYGDQLDGEAQEYMDYAVDGARRMREMINGLLDYSRVHTKGIDPQWIDPDEVLDGVERSLHLQIADRNATVDRSSLPEVEADPDQLGQVFQNLLSNAIEHGGESPQIEISAVEADDDTVRFAVADDGRGIPEEQQARIFEVFEQGSRDDAGTGIGLAVCERIVYRHGGDIWVESQPGEGSTFYFTMPAEADSTHEVLDS